MNDNIHTALIHIKNKSYHSAQAAIQRKCKIKPEVQAANLATVVLKLCMQGKFPEASKIIEVFDHD